MRRLVIVAVLVVVVALIYRDPFSEDGRQPETMGTGALTLSQPWPTTGEEVPGFEAKMLDGGEFEMSGGETYVISFWSRLNKSGSYPEFERLAREYGGPDVSFAAVYVGGVPPEERRGTPYAVIQDSAGELTSTYNVKRVPRVFIIQNGEVKLTQDTLDASEMKRELESTLRADT